MCEALNFENTERYRGGPPIMTTIALPRKDKKAFLMKLLASCHSIVTEQLDCSKSWARKPTEKSLEDILDITDTSEFSHASIKDGVFCLRVSATGGVDYFIWANVDRPTFGLQTPDGDYRDTNHPNII